MEIPSKKLATAYEEYKKGVLEIKELTLEENMDLQFEFYKHDKTITDPEVLRFVKLLMVSARKNYK